MDAAAQQEQDHQWMQRALTLAQQAANVGEVPVGALLVRNQQLLGEGFNQPIGRNDSTAHAEIIALRAACAAEQNYRLPQATLYVTIEPCTMCVGAMVHARIARLVYGASELRAGVIESQMQLMEQPFYNHHFTVTGGVMASECAQMMQSFFKSRR